MSLIPYLVWTKQSGGRLETWTIDASSLSLGVSSGWVWLGWECLKKKVSRWKRWELTHIDQNNPIAYLNWIESSDEKLGIWPLGGLGLGFVCACMLHGCSRGPGLGLPRSLPTLRFPEPGKIGFLIPFLFHQIKWEQTIAPVMGFSPRNEVLVSAGVKLGFQGKPQSWNFFGEVVDILLNLKTLSEGVAKVLKGENNIGWFEHGWSWKVCAAT